MLNIGMRFVAQSRIYNAMNQKAIATGYVQSRRIANLLEYFISLRRIFIKLNWVLIHMFVFSIHYNIS